jgi:hypothetical protein
MLNKENLPTTTTKNTHTNEKAYKIAAVVWVNKICKTERLTPTCRRYELVRRKAIEVVQ